MMPFLLHIVLALLWVLLWRRFDFYTLAAGFAVGYLLLVLLGRAVAAPRYSSKLWRLIRFLAYFAKILVIANWQVARLVLAPSLPIHPRIIRYPVAELTPAQVTTFASSITLTPGTLAVELSPDDRWLYVHCIDAAARAPAVEQLDELKQRLVKEVFS
jgi:multicomponent Na+:H+ antiporter subunit E